VLHDDDLTWIKVLPTLSALHFGLWWKFLLVCYGSNMIGIMLVYLLGQLLHVSLPTM